MASHLFHELFIHLNWHTKEDQALLNEKLEPQVHEFLKRRCMDTKGVYFHGVGGTSTHVHLVLQIEPSVCISDLVGDLKEPARGNLTPGSATGAGMAAGFWRGQLWQKATGLGVGVCRQPEGAPPVRECDGATGEKCGTGGFVAQWRSPAEAGWGQGSPAHHRLKPVAKRKNAG